MLKLIPQDRHDFEAYDNLQKASNAELLPVLNELLECLKDFNWPIAKPVAVRLAVLNEALVEPLLRILNGTDEVWKYWIVTHLLYQVDASDLNALSHKLNNMQQNPTQAEIDEEVFEAVCELIAS